MRYLSLWPARLSHCPPLQSCDPRRAQVRVSGEGQARSPYYADLEAAQQAAEAKELGLWTKARARRSCLTQ
jgi:hypothetical protein